MHLVGMHSTLYGIAMVGIKKLKGPEISSYSTTTKARMSLEESIQPLKPLLPIEDPLLLILCATVGMVDRQS